MQSMNHLGLANIQLGTLRFSVIFKWLLARQEQGKMTLIYLLLALVTLRLYWPVTGFDFINFDDDQYVTCNRNVQAGYTGRSIGWAFTTHQASNWHPITWLSHMLDGQLYGIHAGGHHFTNVIFHCANVLLLFSLLRRLTGATWPSALVAALFAWHPLHVESVAWVSERKDVLSTFFALLALWAYWYYTRVRSWQRYGLTLLCFSCGLMAKPMLVTLPLLFLLLDYWPLGRHRELKIASDKLCEKPVLVWFDLVLEKIPFFVLSAASCGMTFWAQVIMHEPVAGRLFFSEKLANAVNSYASYIVKFLWPDNLSVFYPYPQHFSAVQVMVSVLFLVSVSWLVGFNYRNRPHLLVGWLWYLITLVPVIGLVQVGGQALADRYTYIPSIGLFIAIVWETVRQFDYWGLARWLQGAVAVLVLTACVMITSNQLNYWKDSATLFLHAKHVTQNNSLACCNLGAALLAHGKRAEALEQLNEALRIAPKWPVALNIKGEILYEQGDYQKAGECLTLALAFRPNFDVAHNNFGKVLLAQQKLGAAEAHFRAAVKCNPDVDSYRVNLGLCLARQGRLNEATAQFNAAQSLTPSCEAENALGSVLEKEGKIEQAIEQYQAALTMNPDFAEAQCNLGAILTEQGKFAEAAKFLAAAIRFKPDFAEAHYNLGNVLIHQEKLEEAALHYSTAIKLKPDYMEAYFNLGNVLIQQRRYAESLPQFIIAARLQPDFAEIQIRMAIVLARLGNSRDATSHYREALRLDAESIPALQGLAWILATDTDANVRNGVEAIKLATLAIRLDKTEDPIIWDTLAAAYAESGKFGEAVKTADKAIKLAKADELNNLTGEIKRRRLGYEHGSSFHEAR